MGLYQNDITHQVISEVKYVIRSHIAEKKKLEITPIHYIFKVDFQF